jgi:hypothetical protein
MLFEGVGMGSQTVDSLIVLPTMQSRDVEF